MPQCAGSNSSVSRSYPRRSLSCCHRSYDQESPRPVCRTMLIYIERSCSFSADDNIVLSFFNIHVYKTCTIFYKSMNSSKLRRIGRFETPRPFRGTQTILGLAGHVKGHQAPLTRLPEAARAVCSTSTRRLRRRTPWVAKMSPDHGFQEFPRIFEKS